jgi:membrane protease YdiL (CAAX protease family)
MSDGTNVASILFFNRRGELRCGWRIATFLVLFTVCITFLVGLAELFIYSVIEREVENLNPTGIPSFARTLIEQCLSLLAVIVASAVCARLLERRTLGSIGFKLHTGWMRDSLLGLALGTLSIGIAVAIGVIWGAVRIELNPPDMAELMVGLTALFVFFGISAAFEELLVRGFVFQALAYDLNSATALVITSLAFSLLHVWNPAVTIFSLANTILAGIWLGTAYLKTRSLWLATALHMAWNFSMAFIFGLPVSGLTAFSQSGILKGMPGSPEWISGGSYGPEGGAVATVALILSTLVLWKSSLFHTSNEMRVREQIDSNSRQQT